MEYQARAVRFSCIEEATAWLRRMNCDPAGVAIMAPKAIFRTVCVENVPTKAANLLKQTFLAKGAEVAVGNSRPERRIYGCADLRNNEALSAGVGAVAAATLGIAGSCEISGTGIGERQPKNVHSLSGK